MKQVLSVCHLWCFVFPYSISYDGVTACLNTPPTVLIAKEKMSNLNMSNVLVNLTVPFHLQKQLRLKMWQIICTQNNLNDVLISDDSWF